MSPSIPFPLLRPGDRLGPSESQHVTSPIIQQFAGLTGDTQWIHTDDSRAAESPYGSVIAHGYLLLAMLPVFTRQLVDFADAVVLNYGLDRVRFIAPVLAGSAVHDTIEVIDIDHRPTGQLLQLRHHLDTGSALDVACVAETLSMIN